jgi:isoprenylcysteine carboxyl methyltransferase (ICMT) family protein YpbQ
MEDMQTYLILFLALAFMWRIFTVVLSSRHEALLKQSGAQEHNAGTSVFLAAFHVCFYLSALAEGTVVGRIRQCRSWGSVFT